jgi:hypothetical protein
MIAVVAAAGTARDRFERFAMEVAGHGQLLTEYAVPGESVLLGVLSDGTPATNAAASQDGFVGLIGSDLLDVGAPAPRNVENILVSPTDLQASAPARWALLLA